MADHVNKVSTNKRIRYIYNVFSHWLRPVGLRSFGRWLRWRRVPKQWKINWRSVKLFRQSILLSILRGPLQWRQNELAGVSNHQPPDCLLNGLFRRRLKKTSKLRTTGLCGEFTGDRWIPRTKGQWRGKCFHLMTSSWKPPSQSAPLDNGNSHWGDNTILN